jgi:hypothetical protein
MAKPIDYGDLEFTRPAKQIKAVNLPAVPQRIFDGMKQYEDAARGVYFFFGRKRGSISGLRPPHRFRYQMLRADSQGCEW